MRIAYCTNVRLPNERAHGHQIARVTDAMALLGHSVEIFAPFRKNPIEQDFESYYGIRHIIPVHYLGSFDGIAAWWMPGVVGLKITTALYASALKMELGKRKIEFDILYTRTSEILPAIISIGLPFILELHRIPRRNQKRFVKLARKANLIVALTSPMRAALLELGINDVPIIVEGDGVDLSVFTDLPSRAECRALFSLPQETQIIGYTGQLESMGLSKGIPELLAALLSLERRGLEFHAVIAGGPEEVKDRFVANLPEELVSHVTFLGYISHQRIPTLLTACDVLVYPSPKSNHPFYIRDTSPLKIFEYMAAKRPVVSADLPPVRDILSDKIAYLCLPGDGEALAESIRSALIHKEETQDKVQTAYGEVMKYMWDKRMERVLKSVRLQ